MWKLTVYQPKKYRDWETDQEISFTGDLVDLQHLIMCMASTNAKVRFEISQVEEGEEE
jgi:hypothetical protein